jgi:hypothetical protein
MAEASVTTDGLTREKHKNSFNKNLMWHGSLRSQDLNKCFSLGNTNMERKEQGEKSLPSLLW